MVGHYCCWTLQYLYEDEMMRVEVKSSWAPKPMDE